MRIGVDRFQSTGADVGTNFRRLFNLEPGAYHTEASFSLILTVLRGLDGDRLRVVREMGRRPRQYLAPTER